MSEQENSKKSLKATFLNYKKWIAFFISKKWKMLMWFIIGGLLALAYCFIKPVEYMAKTDFFVNNDDASSSAPSVPGLSMLGITAGGAPGLFTGDNLIWLYTSQRMIEETLLSPMDSSGAPILYELIKIDRTLNKTFGGYTHKPFNSLYKDSVITYSLQKILNSAVSIVRNNYLVVTGANTDGTLISVNFTCKNEKLSKNFVDHIVKSVNTYYIDLKTKKLSDQVAVLYNKVKGYNTDLTGSIEKSASLRQSVPHANPNQPTLQVAPSRSDVNVQVNATLYSQLVAQLEAAKLSLAKSTPVIQIINEPRYPLITIKPSKIIYPIAGAFMLLIVSMIVMFFRQWYKEVMAS